jgi:hypothetical protein
MHEVGPGPGVEDELGGTETRGEGVSCLQPINSNLRPIASLHFRGTILKVSKNNEYNVHFKI